jgi:hypothetical protein
MAVDGDVDTAHVGLDAHDEDRGEIQMDATDAAVADVPASEAADVPAGDVMDVPADRVFDAIAWDASLECDGITCGADEICLRTHGGLESSIDMFSCNRIPSECAATPTCECIAHSQSLFAFQCQVVQWCKAEGVRRFACGEGV